MKYIAKDRQRLRKLESVFILFKRFAVSRRKIKTKTKITA